MSHTWSAATSLNIPRQGLAATTADAPSPSALSSIYAVGGNGGAGPVKTAEAYDPVQKTWTTINPMPTARSDLAATSGRGPAPKPASRTGVYAIGGDNGSTPLAAVEFYDPSMKTWSSVLAMPTARSSLAAVTGADGLIYAIGGYNGSYLGTVQVYDPVANTWTYRSPLNTARGQLAAVRGMDGLIYAMGGTNATGTLASLEIFDPATNKWTNGPSMPAAVCVLAAAAGPDGLIYAVGGRASSGQPLNTVYAYDPLGKAWSTQASLPTPRFALAADTGPDGLIYAIGGINFSSPDLATVEAYTTLSISSFALPPSSGGVPEAIVMGRDGHLWFTEFFGSKIARVDPKTGAIVEYPTPTANSFPRGICTGPGSDNHIWFTEETFSIGRLDPTTGQITEFPIPTTAGVPWGITAGHDGNLWFTAQAGVIGRLNPTTGVVTEFSLLSVNSKSLPAAITTASNGDLWFIDGNHIGHLAPSSPNAPTEYAVPRANDSTQGIVAGPDGNIWFTEQGDVIPPTPLSLPGKIARMTPAGVLSGEFPTPWKSSEPLGITVGPDKNLWFTEFRAGKIGRMTTSGVLTGEFPVGVGTLPGGIAAGPGNTVWFTYYAGVERIIL